MLFWIILGAYWTWGIVFTLKQKRGRRGSTFFFVLWVSLFVTMFGILITSGISHATAPGFSQQSVETRKLQALNTGSSIDGHFFLGSGRFEDEQVFTYTYSDENGGFHLDRSPAYNSVVYEETDEKPHLDIVFWKSNINPWITPVDFFEKEVYTYVYYVPEGSVLSNYEVSP